MAMKDLQSLIQLYIASIWMLHTKLCDEGHSLEVSYVPNEGVFEDKSPTSVLNQLFFTVITSLLTAMRNRICAHLIWDDEGQKYSTRVCLSPGMVGLAGMNEATAQVKMLANCLRASVSILHHIISNRSRVAGLLGSSENITLGDRFCFINMQKTMWYSAIFVTPRDLGNQWWADDTKKAVVNQLTKRTAELVSNYFSELIESSSEIQACARKCLQIYNREESDKALGVCTLRCGEWFPSPKGVRVDGKEGGTRPMLPTLTQLPVKFCLLHSQMVGCNILVTEGSNDGITHDTAEYGVLAGLLVKLATEWAIQEWCQGTEDDAEGVRDGTGGMKSTSKVPLMLDDQTGEGTGCGQCETTKAMERWWNTRGASVVYGSDGVARCTCQRVSSSTVLRLNGLRTYVRSAALYALPHENRGAKEIDATRESVNGLKGLIG